MGSEVTRCSRADRLQVADLQARGEIELDLDSAPARTRDYGLPTRTSCRPGGRTSARSTRRTTTHRRTPHELHGRTPGCPMVRVERGVTAPETCLSLEKDGARSVEYVRGDGTVRLTGRNGTDRFPEIAETHAGVPGPPLILDGETSSCSATGPPSSARSEPASPPPNDAPRPPRCATTRRPCPRSPATPEPPCTGRRGGVCGWVASGWWWMPGPGAVGWCWARWCPGLLG